MEGDFWGLVSSGSDGGGGAGGCAIAIILGGGEGVRLRMAELMFPAGFWWVFAPGSDGAGERAQRASRITPGGRDCFLLRLLAGWLAGGLAVWVARFSDGGGGFAQQTRSSPPGGRERVRGAKRRGRRGGDAWQAGRRCRRGAGEAAKLPRRSILGLRVGSGRGGWWWFRVVRGSLAIRNRRLHLAGVARLQHLCRSIFCEFVR